MPNVGRDKSNDAHDGGQNKDRDCHTEIKTVHQQQCAEEGGGEQRDGSDSKCRAERDS